MKKRKPSPDANVHLYRGRELARLTDLQLATQTIGETHVTRLAWVIRFISEDPERWHPAMRAVHGDCLISLARPTLTTLAGGRALPGSLTPDEIVALHGELRTTVRALINTNPEGVADVSIPTEGLTEHLVRLRTAGKKPAVFGVSYGFDNPRTAIFQAVKTLILQAGARLIGCPECQTPFLATHKAKFCTPNCSQRARNKKRIRIDTRPRRTAGKDAGNGDLQDAQGLHPALVRRRRARAAANLQGDHARRGTHARARHPGRARSRRESPR